MTLATVLCNRKTISAQTVDTETVGCWMGMVLVENGGNLV
jgi:hypothetical protein